MELDLDQLEELLVLCRAQGVSKFSCPGFTFDLQERFAPKVEPTVAEAIKEAIEEGGRSSEKAAPKGVYGHRSLWPDGPPTFPVRDRE